MLDPKFVSHSKFVSLSFLIKSDTLTGSQLLTNCVGEDRLVSESGKSSNIEGIFVVYYLGYPAKIFFPLIGTGGSFEVFLQARMDI